MNPIEEANDELVDTVEKTPDSKSGEVKKNSKKDIVNRIFQVTQKYNFEICETEQQLLRKTRKQLLQILAGFVERSVENTIKSSQNGINPECQESKTFMHLPVLKLAHGFACSLLEKGVNSGMSYLDYQYEISNYAKTCNSSTLIDDCLLDIASELGDEFFDVIGNPYCRLLFIHCTSIMSCIQKIDKQCMRSPRININP